MTQVYKNKISRKKEIKDQIKLNRWISRIRILKDKKNNSKIQS